MCFIRIHRIEEAAHPVLRVLKRAVPNFKRDVVVVNAGLHYGVREPAYRRAASMHAVHVVCILYAAYHKPAIQHSWHRHPAMGA